MGTNLVHGYQSNAITISPENPWDDSWLTPPGVQEYVVLPPTPHP